jgi:DEAD/DEAH box helicase domain-containing protein
MCDPRDLGIGRSEEGNLYLYDSYPGGIGLSGPLYRMATRLFAQTAELLDGCGCDAGCPSCVGPAGEVGERGKLVARRILAELLGPETLDPVHDRGEQDRDQGQPQ